MSDVLSVEAFRVEQNGFEFYTFVMNSKTLRRIASVSTVAYPGPATIRSPVRCIVAPAMPVGCAPRVSSRPALPIPSVSPPFVSSALLMTRISPFPGDRSPARCQLRNVPARSMAAVQR